MTQIAILRKSKFFLLGQWESKYRHVAMSVRSMSGKLFKKNGSKKVAKYYLFQNSFLIGSELVNLHFVLKDG